MSNDKLQWKANKLNYNIIYLDQINSDIKLLKSHIFQLYSSQTIIHDKGKTPKKKVKKKQKKGNNTKKQHVKDCLLKHIRR